MILSLVVTLLSLELGLRVLWLKQLTIKAGIEHPHFHHRLNPNQTYHFYSGEFDVNVRTNGYGLRGPDPVVPKPTHTLRILMLGDSFTFGFPVQDQQTFSALIEHGLRAQGYAAEVVNAGVSGYSPTLHYISLRDQFLDFQPDLVMLWYDYGDLQEDSWFQKNLIYDPQGQIVRCDPRYRNGRFDWWEWGRNHSALIRYTDIKVIRLFNYLRVLGLDGYVQVKLRGERAKVAVARVKRSQADRDLPAFDRFLLVRDTTSDEVLDRYWPVSARYIRMIRDVLTTRGIPLVFGSYPYGMVVGPDQWAAGRKFFGFEPGKIYDGQRANAFLERFAKEENVPFITALSAFQRAAAREKLYYDQDGHMTPAGHRVLAQTVLRDERFLTLVRQQAGRVGAVIDTQAPSKW